MMHADLSRSLEDVREAHRLLYTYYRRILDTARLLGDQFSTHAFYQWSSLVTDHPPMRGTRPFERWGWDFLPMNSVSFLYASAGRNPGRIDVGDWMLEIHATSDSEFSPLKEFKGEPDPTEFAPAHNSRSEMAIVAWKCVGPLPADKTWLRIWQQGHWPDEASLEAMTAFEAIEGVETFLIKRPIDLLASRTEVMTFAEEAKAAFSKVLDV